MYFGLSAKLVRLEHSLALVFKEYAPLQINYGITAQRAGRANSRRLITLWTEIKEMHTYSYQALVLRDSQGDTAGFSCFIKKQYL